MADSVHQLKITLRGVKPSVWRRVVVRTDLSLGELAPILEGAMGWLGGHLHMFDVDGTWYGSPSILIGLVTISMRTNIDWARF